MTGKKFQKRRKPRSHFLPLYIVQDGENVLVFLFTLINKNTFIRFPPPIFGEG